MIAWTSRCATVLAAAVPIVVAAADAAPVPTTFAVTSYYYAMRDEADFGVGVATLDHGPWHLEGRYNYEVHNAGLAFSAGSFPAARR